MQARNPRSSPLRAGAAVALALLLALPKRPSTRSGPGGEAARRAVGEQREPQRIGHGRSWSGPRTSGTTSRTATGSGSSRTTTATTRSGQSADRHPRRQQVGRRRDGEPQRPDGERRQQELLEDLRDGRRHVESVSRDVQATSRSGQTASWEGKAERSGYGWEFEGEGTNRYGQKVEAEGYGARGRYGSGVVADVEGGRYGDRTVVAGRAYGGPVHAAQLPYGARPYHYHGHSYYHHGGRLLSAVLLSRRSRTITTCGRPGAATTRRSPSAPFTIAGMALLYSDGTYYKTTYVRGGDPVPGRGASGGSEPPRGHHPARRQDRDHDLGDDVLSVRQHVLQGRG